MHIIPPSNPSVLRLAVLEAQLRAIALQPRLWDIRVLLVPVKVHSVQCPSISIRSCFSPLRHLLSTQPVLQCRRLSAFLRLGGGSSCPRVSSFT
jgi:hypothetical protein